MKKQILWISNASMGQSETFLQSNLNVLRKLGNVDCINLNRYRLGSTVGFLPLVGPIFNALLRQFIRINRWKYDVIWIEYGTTLETVAEILTTLKCKIVVNFHGYDISRKLASPKYQALIEAYCRKPNVHCLVASKYNHNKLLLLGASPERLHVVRYALEPEDFVVEIESKTAYPSFVFFGRLTEKKNPIILVYAFQKVVEKYPKARLTLIGSGHLLTDLQSAIVKLGLESSVSVLPGMPRNEALKIIKSHWVFCQHSVSSFNGDQEGFALSPAEAALMEMPVISTYHNGIPEHVISGKTGILVPEWDIHGTSEAMLILAADDSLRREMGLAGAKNIRELCDPSVRQRLIHNVLFS